MRGFVAEPFEMATKSSVKVRPKIVPLDPRNPQQQSITGQAAAPAPMAWGPEETDFRRASTHVPGTQQKLRCARRWRAT